MQFPGRFNQPMRLQQQHNYVPISKTGPGKSAVPLTIVTLCRGVTVVMVPLFRLESDQVKKAMHFEKGVKAYHVDEHCGEDGRLLRN